MKQIIQEHLEKIAPEGQKVVDVYSAWDEVVGNTELKKYTSLLSYDHCGKLYVKVYHPSIKQDILYRKKQIINNINKKLKKRVVRDIVFEQF